MEATGEGPRTLFEKIWSRHRVVEREDGQTLLYVDRHLLHDGGATAFDVLRKRGMKPRAPERVFATPDHYVATDSRTVEGIQDPRHREMVEKLARNTAEAGIRMFGLGDPNQGIVHVVGPETGLSQPGLLLVCGDSHTPRPMARWARWPSASAARRSPTCWRPRPCGSASRRPCA